jgi:hypothetical protein
VINFLLLLITRIEIKNINTPQIKAIQIGTKAAVTVGIANIAVHRYKITVVRC